MTIRKKSLQAVSSVHFHLHGAAKVTVFIYMICFSQETNIQREFFKVEIIVLMFNI